MTHDTALAILDACHKGAAFDSERAEARELIDRVIARYPRAPHGHLVRDIEHLAERTRAAAY